MNKLIMFLSLLVVALCSSAALAIDTAALDALTEQGLEVGSYTVPAISFTVLVLAVPLAIVWTKRFISKAL